MISVSKALSLISNIPLQPKQKKVPLHSAKGLILSVDIMSPISMPPFRQSAMDGYALLVNDNTTVFEVIGEVKAGDSTDFQLKHGQAIRIFTGARVPDNANTVVIQEKVLRTGNSITIQEKAYLNKNIRNIGEQIQKGTIALKKGTKLTPAAIGFLAGLGINMVSVFLPPKVGVIITGNELIQSGDALSEGKIYESNYIQLEAALGQLHIDSITKYVVKDDYISTKNSIANAIENNDLVLISGGISVGDYDFVKEALSELNTEEVFYKIKQKPGKPLFFGTNNITFIFALPGNPASSLTCFYIYVVSIINRLMGNSEIGLSRVSKKSTAIYIKKSDRSEFLKAKVSGQQVEILEGQSSAMLSTYAVSNALVFIPEEVYKIEKGESVETILLSN